MVFMNSMNISMSKYSYSIIFKLVSYSLNNEYFHIYSHSLSFTHLTSLIEINEKNVESLLQEA